jgi:dATP pyrophosphohydrolase
MARSPFQILVFPYYQFGGDEYEYALLKRSDAGWWQAVAGGGEDDETPLEAAKREANEEIGIAKDSFFLCLDTIVWVRVTEFSDSYLWGENVYVIPQYCFGVLARDKRIVISDEHSEFRWLKYKDADAIMTYEGNRTAFWELNQRLKNKGPRG